MKRLISLFLLVHALMCSASDIVSVSGESTYYDDGTKSKSECVRLAAEQARINALARKFGTIVSQDILQTDRIAGNREQNDFLALTSSEVRGEWIADVGEPEYEFSHDSKSNLIVHCKIRGKAKEITNSAAPFEARVLRNGTDLRNADNIFRDGDDMFLHFRTSADGYLAVFLEDEAKDVYLLLPYPRDPKSRLPVIKDKDYVFFSRDRDKENGALVEEMVMTAPDNLEYNRVYVVFSPEPFSRPVMDTATGLPVMKSAEFNKWLIKNRLNDSRMGVKAMNLQISPR